MKQIDAAAGFIYDRLKPTQIWEKIVSRETAVRLAAGQDPEEYRRRTVCVILKRIMLVLLGTVILTLAAGMLKDASVTDGNYLDRPASGEGSRTYDLAVSSESLEEDIELSVTIDEVKVPEEELEDYFEAAFDYISEAVLGSNPDAEHVSLPLSLVATVPGTPIKVSWEGLDGNPVYSDGSLNNEAITDPVYTELTARVEYFDEVRILIFPICVQPEQEDEKDRLKELLTGILGDRNTGSPESERIELPREIDGYELGWSGREEQSGPVVALLGIMTAGLMLPLSKYEMKRREKDREEQMLRDYPDIVSKMVMLLSAGMTCRTAWERIARDSGRNSRTAAAYAYREMQISEKELALGLPEAGVYESFGNRCGVNSYRRFGTLLAGNLKRGSRELTGLLELESAEAFAARREAVQKKAEELGTKLLMPMMVMLCIVIALVVVPAFRSFNV